MEIEDKGPLQNGALSALDRARIISQALSDAARRSRISARSRRYSGGGFQARRGAALMRWAAAVSFCLIVILPSVATAIYYTFVASDQYVAETRFTVSGGEAPAIDGLGALTGLPAMAVIQDTQIVTNYVESRDALEKLQKRVNIRDLYSTTAADWFSRFDPEKPIEKFVKYWQHMCDISIKMPSGIVELKVRAFTREDATRIAQAVIEISESLINDLNDRMNRDAVTGAQEELDRTSRRLVAAQAALEAARNDEGLLDANKAAESLSKLIGGSRTELLQMQGQFVSLRKFVSENAPQMIALKSRMDATTAQIADLESRLTATSASRPGESPLSASMTKFAELDLERQTAEHLYAGSVATLEFARLASERQMMYINTFVRPVAPEEAQYPKRFLYSFLMLAACVCVWGLSCGLAVMVRNHMA